MNNLEKLDRNYFWNERPRVTITELERYFADVYDVTYVNDQAPSLEINERYYLFLPNSLRCNPDTEEYNYYMILNKEEYGLDAMTIECPTLDKAIDELTELLNT
tara:strand:+ start:369 stop:680 length:312 start_codon:yes stop_codon:yes gene_type:complete